MRKIWFLFVSVAVLTACGDGRPRAAEAMLEQACRQFEQHQYDRALITIDSLRKVYPEMVEVRKQALRLQQDIELERSQKELAVVDSALEVVKKDYELQKSRVEQAKKALKATPEELTRLTKTRVRRDSLQTQFEVLCAKIKYIHQKQKEAVGGI